MTSRGRNRSALALLSLYGLAAGLLLVASAWLVIAGRDYLSAAVAALGVLYHAILGGLVLAGREDEREDGL